LWGNQPQRFVSLAIYQRGWQPTPPGMACVNPELNLPESMYPARFSLSRAIAMYAADGVFPEVCPISVRSALADPATLQVNLLKSTDLNQGPVHGNAYSFANASPVSLETGGSSETSGSPALRIELPRAGSAYGFDLGYLGDRQPYTFAASVRLLSGGPTAVLRILSKDRAGNILETVNSEPISSPQFHVVLLSVYLAQNTASASVDFANLQDSSTPVVIAVKQAVFLQHPVYLKIPQLFTPPEGIR
jgi:hypothetical protein